MRSCCSNPVFLLLMAFALQGCSFVRVAESPKFDKTLYESHTPRRLAIGRLQNLTTYKDADKLFRSALYGAFAPMNYEDVELGKVDGFVNARAMANNVTPAELNPWFIADPELADAVVFAEVKKISRFFLFFYSHLRADLDLSIVDSSTKKVFYENQFIVRDRTIEVPLSPLGIAKSIFSTLWHVRGDQTKTLIMESAEAVAEKFQSTINKSVSIDHSLAKLEINVPEKKILTEGDKIEIKLSGAPNWEASYSLGSIVQDQPMKESAAGTYSASYSIKQGDNSRFVFATVNLQNPDNPSEKTTYAADDQPLVIKSSPPPPYLVQSWRCRPGNEGICLAIEPEQATKAAADPSPMRFFVYRAQGRGKSLKKIGFSDTPEFEDLSAQVGVEYQYGVIAEDDAGNKSSLGPRVLITPHPSESASARR